MPEAVIVATARSPIGRANKGSLVDDPPRRPRRRRSSRPLLAKVPAARPRDRSRTSSSGCGQPAGEAGFNIARVVAILAGLDDVPGVTVNRYCSSSLQTIRMAAHAIKAGEGDVLHRRRRRDRQPLRRRVRSDTAPNPIFKPAGRAHRSSGRGGGQPPWTPPEGLPDIYIAMGQTAENVVEFEDVSREEMDEFAKRSQDRAVANIENGFFDDEITPVTLPDGTVVAKDDGPRAGTTLEGLAELKPVFRPDGKVTAGNACPLNDGAAAVLVMSDTQGGRARPHAARPDRVVGRLRR